MLQPFPIPTLSPLIGINVPIYDLADSLNAEQSAFLSSVGYVADNASKVRTITIWMIIATAIFLILALVATVLYYKS